MANSSNLIQEKSFDFAILVINTYKSIVASRKEFVLSKQLLRSGTSIGANVEEAIGAQSKKDFVNKMFIAYKEARETRYWLKLLKASNYLDTQTFTSLEGEIESICRILGKIISSAKHD